MRSRTRHRGFALLFRSITTKVQIVGATTSTLSQDASTLLSGTRRKTITKGPIALASTTYTVTSGRRDSFLSPSSIGTSMTIRGMVGNTGLCKELSVVGTTVPRVISTTSLKGSVD